MQLVTERVRYDDMLEFMHKLWHPHSSRRASAIRLFSLLFFLSTLGSPAQTATTPEAGLTVYVFLNSECPISQQYIRQLSRLYEQFRTSGVRFVALFPLRTDTPAQIKKFRAEYKLPFLALPDQGARLARQFRVQVTPEVVLMQADGRVRYQGAIDDWYVDLGKHRSQATRQYLHDALNAVLNGQTIAHTRTDAVGCLIE